MADPTGYKFLIQNSDGTYQQIIKGNGLWSAGQNISGTLGNGTTINYSSPIQVGSLTNWSQISCGYRTSLAIKSDGTLWAWGQNNYGQLGNNTTTYFSSPIQIGSLTNWKQISTDGSTAAAIKTDGTLWTWGYNIYGTLGNDNRINYSSPIQVGLLTNWSQVSASGTVLAAVKTDGTLWVCGRNSRGTLGNGTTVYYSSPIQVGSLTNWKQVSVSDYTAVAVKTDGTLWTWGYNNLGQLGNETVTQYSSPIQIGSLTNWKEVSYSEGANVIAIKTDGTLWTWGYNFQGQLGNGTTINYSSPIQVGLLSNWNAIDSGGTCSSAIKTDGTLWVWGDNTNGQLGNGSNGNKYSSPIQVGSLTYWKQASLGNDILLALGEVTTVAATDMADMFVGKDSWYNAGLWVAGYNNDGALGIGSTIRYSSPVQVGSLTNWRQVAGGTSVSAAIKTDGTLWMWGRNSIPAGSFTGSILGNGVSASYSSPIQVGTLSNWKQVSVGYAHTLAVKTDGTLWAWGNNQTGELGIGTTSNGVGTPTQVGLLTNWKQVDCGSGSTVAVKTDGTLWSWGRNDNGQLGNGSNGNKYSSPIQVGTLSNWKQVSIGYYNSAAIKTDGTLWTWGYNVYGALGNGTTIDYSSPVQIGSLTNWKQVSLGDYHISAIKTDGTLWACGYNNYGGLGNGNTISYSSPIQIGSLNNWKQVACGYIQTAAIKNDGTLWAWGYNAYGQLGNGTVTSYSSPIQIGSLTIWNKISFGAWHSLQIQAPDYELPQYVPGAPTGLSV